MSIQQAAEAVVDGMKFTGAVVYDKSKSDGQVRMHAPSLPCASLLAPCLLPPPHTPRDPPALRLSRPSSPSRQHKKTAANTKLAKLYPEFQFTPFKEAIARTCEWFEANYETARK